jgi:hypothetical protein
MSRLEWHAMQEAEIEWALEYAKICEPVDGDLLLNLLFYIESMRKLTLNDFESRNLPARPV